jgi:hypothetical protein
MLGLAIPIGVGTEAAAVPAVRAVTTSEPAIRTPRRRPTVVLAVDVMLISSPGRVGFPGVRTGGRFGSIRAQAGHA